jgi:presenilin-like A22 family membrane protease
MNLGKRINDSFAFGLLAGLISLVLFYFLFTAVRTLLINYYGNPYILRPPVVQLLTMLVNIIIFRLMMINYGREKTGKGLLFVTVLSTFIYFFIFLKLNRS